MHFTSWRSTMFIIGIPYLFACQNSTDQGHHHEDQSFGKNRGQTSPEPLGMIDSVQKAQQQIDPTKITIFFSAQRAELYKNQLEKLTGLEKANMMVMYGRILSNLLLHSPCIVWRPHAF